MDLHQALQGEVIMNTNHFYHSEHEPKTVVSEQSSKRKMTDDEKINAAAERILNQYRAAFEELAK